MTATDATRVTDPAIIDDRFLGWEFALTGSEWTLSPAHQEFLRALTGLVTTLLRDHESVGEDIAGELYSLVRERAIALVAASGEAAR